MAQGAGQGAKVVGAVSRKTPLKWKVTRNQKRPIESVTEAFKIVEEWDDEYDSDDYIERRFLPALEVIAQSEDDLDERHANALWQKYTSENLSYLHAVFKDSFHDKLGAHLGLAIRLLGQFGDMKTRQLLQHAFSSAGLSFEEEFGEAQKQILDRTNARMQQVSQDVQNAIGENLARTISQQGTGFQDAASLNALVQSKIESYQNQMLVVLRLTKHNAQVHDAILKDQSLQTVRAQVEEAGCKIFPDWAAGCVVLAPLTEQQVNEAGVTLRAHHIIVAQQHQALVEKVFTAIPKRRRPIVMPADTKRLSITEPGPSDVERTYATPKHEPQPYLALLDEWDGLWEVERTFVHFPLHRAMSASLREVQSDPGDGAAETRPLKFPRLLYDSSAQDTAYR